MVLGKNIKRDEGSRFCRDCKFWTPKYYGVGACSGESRPSAKFWIEGDKDSRLLTLASFSCSAFEPQPDTSRETI